MRTHFASILSCLLLLPIVGSGQGIDIKNIYSFICDENISSYEGRQYSPSEYVSIVDTERVLTQNKVSRVVVYRLENESLIRIYEAQLDQNGKMTSQLRVCNSKEYAIRQDSIFGKDKVICITKIFKVQNTKNALDLQQNPIIIDTLIVQENRLVYRGDSMIVIRRTNRCYRQGLAINNRNESINKHKPETNRNYLANKYGWNTGYFYTSDIEKTKLKTDYNKNELFLCKSQSWIMAKPLNSKVSLSYRYIKRIKKLKQELKKSYYITYVDGEDASDVFDLKDSYRWYCRVPGMNTNQQYIKIKNSRGLTDSIIMFQYNKQEPNQPCVKPRFSDESLYLFGFSGIPQKTTTEIIIKYDYFDK